MGTTINGVYEGGKRMRRVRALKRLENSVVLYQKDIDYLKALPTPRNKANREVADYEDVNKRISYCEKHIKRINTEITILKSRI